MSRQWVALSQRRMAAKFAFGQGCCEMTPPFICMPKRNFEAAFCLALGVSVPTLRPGWAAKRRQGVNIANIRAMNWKRRLECCFVGWECLVWLTDTACL